MSTIVIPLLFALAACVGSEPAESGRHPVADAPEDQAAPPVDDGVAPTEATPDEAPRRFRPAPPIPSEPFGPPEAPEREPDTVDV